MLSSLLQAWASCGDDDAGRRADLLLRDMEEKSEEDENLRPNARSYCLVLTAWSKSSSLEKADRALEILERMERRYEEDQQRVRPGERPYS